MAGVEQAGQLAGRLDRPHAAAGQQQHGAAGHLRGQVHRRERLAGAGRAVQQDAALEVPAGRAQPLGVAAEAERVPLDPPQQRLGQDDLVAADAGQGVEVDGQPAVAVLLERQDVAAVGLAVVRLVR